MIPPNTNHWFPGRTRWSGRVRVLDTEPRTTWDIFSDPDISRIPVFAGLTPDFRPTVTAAASSAARSPGPSCSWCGMTRWRNWLASDAGTSRGPRPQEHFIDLCRMLGQPTPNDADPNRRLVRLLGQRARLADGVGGGVCLARYAGRSSASWPSRAASPDGGSSSAGSAHSPLAILSPIDALSDSLATVHMVQHMAPAHGRGAALLPASGLATLLLGAATHRAYRLISADFLIATGTSGGQPEDGLIRWPTAESRDRRASVSGSFHDYEGPWSIRGGGSEI